MEYSSFLVWLISLDIFFLLLRALFLLTYFADFNVVFIQAATGQSPLGKELSLLEYLHQFLGYRDWIFISRIYKINFKDLFNVKIQHSGFHNFCIVHQIQG